MDDKQTALEVKRGDRSYKLYCDNDSTLQDLMAVLCEFQYYVMSRMKETQQPQGEEPSVNPDEILPKEE
jgi:hypothetical protein